MAATGEWLAPRLNGVRYFDKPPLLYWISATAFSTSGLDEWAARVAPLLGTLLTAAATAMLGARLLGPAGGLLAAGALVTSGLFIAFGRYVRPETLFAAAIQWSFTGLLLGQMDSNPRRAKALALVGCTALGVAALAKDPLGLFGPLLAVGLALAMLDRLRPLSRWLPAAGIGLLILLGAGWYAALALRQPGFAWYTAVDNHLLNAARLRHFPDEDVPLSAVEFLTVSALGQVPWIFPAIVTMASMVRRRAWRCRAEMAWTALGLWAAGLVALCTAVPFRLPHYALPAYPALALFAARGWQERPDWERAWTAVHAALFAMIAAVLAAAAASSGEVFLSAALSATDVYTRKEAVVGHGAPVPPWSLFAPLAWRTAAVFAAGSAALVALLIARRQRLARWVVLATMLLAVPAVIASVSLVSSSRAVRGLAMEIRRKLAADDLLVHEGPIENSGALELYSGRRPILLDARRSVLGFGATFADAQETFWDSLRFRREWCSGRRILLVTVRPAESSIATRLPPGSLALVAAENGRRLYDSGRATPRRGCAPADRS
jgi:hypothetical protein